MRTLRTFALLLVASASSLQAQQGQSSEPNNGLDPTKPVSTAQVTFENLQFDGDASRTQIFGQYTRPFTLAGKPFALRLRLPYVSFSAPGADLSGIGDAEIGVNSIFGLSRKQGFVATGTLILPTATEDSPVIGFGKTVAKGGFIYARFLQNGIFAPSLTQSFSIGGDAARTDVNLTVLDFYYVPKMKDPRNLVTFDPAISFDWERELSYGILAVQYGRVVGEMFGGRSIAYVKPQFFFGNDAPGPWGVEAGFRVLGF